MGPSELGAPIGLDGGYFGPGTTMAANDKAHSPPK